MTLNFTIKMNSINDTLQEQMTQAQTVYEKFFNCQCDHASVIKTENMIWLDARNLVTEWLSKKLSNKYKESFWVIHTIDTHTFKLKILNNWEHHDVFNNYLLHFTVTDSLSD